MPVTDLDKSELEIAQVYLPAIDPFGFLPYNITAKRWETAKAIDTLFTRKTVTKGKDFGMGEMFYCRDCDSFVKCVNRTHSAFIRCFGAGCEHCIECA